MSGSRYHPQRASLAPRNCRAIFNIIMTPERISRSTRTAHGLVACNFPPQVILLPSPRSVVCIIAMSVESREIGEAARSACPRPIALNSFLGQLVADHSATSLSGRRMRERHCSRPELRAAGHTRLVGSLRGNSVHGLPRKIQFIKKNLIYRRLMM
jgi:hypothetical protein